MASDFNFTAVKWCRLGSSDGLFVNTVKKLGSVKGGEFLEQFIMNRLFKKNPFP
jgi:hypothetical protein